MGSASPPAYANAGLLSRVVYRSRSVGEPTPPDLQQLTQAAQARNQREAITGVMLYDDRRFFQWLEGPSAGVDRIMASIRNDRRHTDIEILASQAAPARTFGEWSMKLATPGPDSVFRQAGVIDPPREIVETLRRKPEAAPVLLVKLLPLAEAVPHGDTAMADDMARMPLQSQIAAILKQVMLSTVIPTLAHGQGGSGPIAVPASDKRAGELADLLIAPDPTAAVELIREIQAGRAPTGRLYASLFEPAARALGDLWVEDICSEFDVTLGLCRLQAAIRQLSVHGVAAVPAGVERPVVLIAPEPGELHRLGASLDTEVLWNAGWAPRIEYPKDDRDLQDLVANAWVDVLDLSLSTAFRRDDWLPRITETIAEARQASQNPALVVVVGGRVFFERGTDADAVGADHATRTAARVDQVILQTLATASTTETLTPTATPG